MKTNPVLVLVAAFVVSWQFTAHGADVLVEAESFDSVGGWKLDTQFIDNMGSPYLLAHGLGRPVGKASTSVKFKELGRYHVFVRTFDWVAKWGASGSPGKFALEINNNRLETVFGTQGREWDWQYGGVVEIDSEEITLALVDLTGFDGRCDAIYFSPAKQPPPNDSNVLPSWRRKLLSLGDAVVSHGGYDLVVVGGGYSGMASAISAARSGCKVALIQNRGVLGGNGSSEVRVWSQGLIRRGKFPRIGEIVEEFCDHAKKSPGTYEEFGDEKKESIVRAEPNIDLFLNHHAYRVQVSDSKIKSIFAFDTKSNEVKRFEGKLFVDCTGHGSIGFMAGGDYEMTPKGRMGMSNMWAWSEAEQPVDFPQTPWALDLEMDDFPYPRAHHGQWFWESGYDKDPINEAESIRDWNLRAVYGAFNAMKNRGGADKHKAAFLTWVAYVGGPRESRRLLGDIILDQDDVVSKKQFVDGCVPSTWSIDLHYPKEQYAKKFPDNPFISIAKHDRRIDRNFGYPVPFRCFYSRNIENLFMAGRCISVTHEALGTTRVMKTCGMMGEVVGKAASVCVKHSCLPRDVYQSYWPEMEKLMQLPGKATRSDVSSNFTVPDDSMQLATEHGPMAGIVPSSLPGIVVDNRNAKLVGSWTQGNGLKGFVGYEYLYASDNSGAQAIFEILVPEDGEYALQIAYQPHENRGTSVPISVASDQGLAEYEVDMTKKPTGPSGFHSLGNTKFNINEKVIITIDSKNAGGMIHADAVQLIKTS